MYGFSHAYELERLDMYISVPGLQAFYVCDGGIFGNIKYFICRFLRAKCGVLSLKTFICKETG